METWQKGSEVLKRRYHVKRMKNIYKEINHYYCNPFYKDAFDVLTVITPLVEGWLKMFHKEVEELAKRNYKYYLESGHTVTNPTCIKNYKTGYVFRNHIYSSLFPEYITLDRHPWLNVIFTPEGEKIARDREKFNREMRKVYMWLTTILQLKDKQEIRNRMPDLLLEKEFMNKYPRTHPTSPQDKEIIDYIHYYNTFNLIC